MKRTLALVFCLLAAPALAADAKQEEKDSAKKPAVLTWLDLQRSGGQASSVPQTLTPVIQERVVKRYLDSFNAPIPVFFLDESVSSPTSSVGR
ncbi:MAG: DUF3613 domain-containing protein [Pedobacter sp.]|nr:DUF3613 domain-containing protein [Pedobacter sp.]